MRTPLSKEENLFLISVIRTEMVDARTTLSLPLRMIVTEVAKIKWGFAAEQRPVRKGFNQSSLALSYFTVLQRDARRAKIVKGALYMVHTIGAQKRTHN